VASRAIPCLCSIPTSRAQADPVRVLSLAWPQPALVAGIALAVVIGSAAQNRVSAEDEPPLLEYSYSGSGPAAREFVRVMQSRAVQRLLLEVAAAPRNRTFLDAALKEAGITADELQTLELVRRDGDRYELAFSLLTREDRQKIQAVAEREGARLASDLLVHRSRIEALLRNGSMPTADWRATAHFILGCASLDWDGLNLVEKKGYLAVPAKGRYLPTAIEPAPREALRQLYWGSHSYHDPAAVTTFGDHYSTPRVGLPDVLWNFSVEAPEPVKSKVRRAAEGLVRRHAAALMLALRDGPRSTTQLAAATGSGQDDVKDVLDLLVALEYVTESDGAYTAVIPLLTERDRPLVRELRLLGRQAMVKWFDERYQTLCDALADLTPRRYGVPLSNSFWWVWHYLFAVANRELVAAGLFADPYESKRKFQGFIPAVYQLSVVQGPF
jgi:DNA-binding MarR family transcriptional regulator